MQEGLAIDLRLKSLRIFAVRIIGVLPVFIIPIFREVLSIQVSPYRRCEIH